MLCSGKTEEGRTMLEVIFFVWLVAGACLVVGAMAASKF